MNKPTDGRIVYGARCTWWDSIDKVAKKPSGLPCCPHCGGVLFEVPTEADWWEQVDDYAAGTEPGYREFIEWLRSRCLSSHDQARQAWKSSP